MAFFLAVVTGVVQIRRPPASTDRSVPLVYYWRVLMSVRWIVAVLG